MFQTLTWSMNGFYLHPWHVRMKARPFPTICFSLSSKQNGIQISSKKTERTCDCLFHYCGCRITKYLRSSSVEDFCDVEDDWKLLKQWWTHFQRLDRYDQFKNLPFIYFSFAVCIVRVKEQKAEGTKQAWNRKKSWAEPIRLLVFWWAFSLGLQVIWNWNLPLDN